MSSHISSFLVFDGKAPIAEGSNPKVFYSYLEAEESEHFVVNQAGIFLALIKFSTFFTTGSTVDYCLTDKHEIAIQELSDGIWLSIAQRYNKFPNRLLLHSLLSCIKQIYLHYFEKPQRDKNCEIKLKSARILQSAFDMIVKAFNKVDMPFIHLFNGYFQLKLPMDFVIQLEPVLTRLLGKNTPIGKLAIMHSRYFLFSNFSIETTRTLAISLSIKFPYLFPQTLEKDEERLYWIIGLSRLKNGNINVYSPPIISNGVQYPLIALRYRKARIIIGLKSDIVPTPELLVKIPKTLNDLTKLLGKITAETVKGTMDVPYLMLKNVDKKNALSLSTSKIPDASIPDVERNITLARQFAEYINGSVAMTGLQDFFTVSGKTADAEYMTLSKAHDRPITDLLMESDTMLSPGILSGVVLSKK